MASAESRVRAELAKSQKWCVRPALHSRRVQSPILLYFYPDKYI